jgi:TolB-like protein
VNLVAVLGCFASLASFAAPPQVKASAPVARPKLIVTALQAAGGVDAAIASTLTESVSAEVAKRGYFDVVSSNDIQTLLGMERQRQMMGCSDDATNCLTELAGAIGARFVMSGSITKLGEAYQLNLQTLDSNKAQPVGRSTRITRNLESLHAQLAYAVAEATATPLPAPPSRVLPYSVMGLGAAGLIAGGVLAMQAFSAEGAVTRELNNGNIEALKTLPAYQREADAIGAQKTWALIAATAGVALVVTGYLLNPKDATTEAPSGSLFSLRAGVGPGGFALAGGF